MKVLTKILFFWPRYSPGHLLAVLASLSLGSCSPAGKPPPSPPRAAALPEEQRLQAEAPIAAGAASSVASKKGPASGAKAFTLIDPDAAVVKFKGEIKLGSSSLVNEFTVPIVELSREEADYIQLLRCAQSYTLRNTLGAPLELGGAKEPGRSDLEWAWAQAVQAGSACKVVGTHLASLRFEDLAAPSGSYYYIANPCVAKDHATTAKDGCSFKLVASHPFTFKEQHDAKLREKFTELSQAEAALTARLEQAILLARKIELHLAACEDMVAHDQQLLSFKTGLVRLGALAVGGLVGYFSPLPMIRGPNGAVMLGMLTQEMGSAILINKVLKWPPYVENECINPQVLAKTDKAEAGQEEASATPKHRGKYEKEFHVQALSQELEELLKPEGAITRETQRVQQLLSEMAELDSRTIALDEALAKAANFGVDPQKPSTFDKLFGIPMGSL